MPDEVSNALAPLRRRASSAFARRVARQRSRPASRPSPIGRSRSRRSRDAPASTSPSSTVWPTPTATTRSTVPARGARSSFCIFMASTTRSCWPATTASPGATATDTTRPGMIARTSVGPPCAAAAPPRRARSRRTARRSDPRPRPRTASRRRRPRPATAGRRRSVRRVPVAPSTRTASSGAGPLEPASAGSGSTTSGPSPDRPGRSRATQTRTASAVTCGHRSMAAARPVRAPAAVARRIAAGAREPAGRLRRAERAARPAASSAARQRAPELAPVRPSARPPTRWRPPPSPEARRPGQRSDGTAASSGCPPISVSSSARRSRSIAASPVRGVDHQLGDQVVVVRRRPGLPTSTPVSTRTPGPAGIAQRRIRPGVGAKSRAGSSAAMRTSIAWPSGSAARSAAASAAVGQRPPGGEPELLADDVEAGDQLGDAVLDLEPGVDLEEAEAAVRVAAGTRRSPRCAGPPPARPGPPGRAARAARRRSARAPAPPRRASGGAAGCEQSRSPSATTRPVASPSSWTSMWRAGRISRSR